MIQEFALDGAVIQVGSKVIRRVCLHSNAKGCQFHEHFCYNRTIQTLFWVHSTYKQHFSITMIKQVCANLERNVLSHIMPWKTKQRQRHLCG